MNNLGVKVLRDAFDELFDKLRGCLTFAKDRVTNNCTRERDVRFDAANDVDVKADIVDEFIVEPIVVMEA